MRLLLFLYLIVLSVEGPLKIKPIMTLGSDFDLSYNLVLLMLIGIGFFLKVIVQKYPIKIKNELFFYHFLFIISLIPVALFSADMLIGASSLLVQLLLQSLIIPIIYLFFDKKQLKQFISFLGIFALIHCFFVYTSYFFSGSLGNYMEVLGTHQGGTQRAFGFLGDSAPWVLGFFAIFALQRKKIIHYIFFAGSCLIGASFGATIVLVVASIACLLAKARAKRLFLLKFSLISTCLVIAFILANPTWLQDLSFTKRIQKGNGIESFNQRLITYGLAFKMIQDRPLTGHGYGTFYYHLKQKIGRRYNRLFVKGGALTNANNQFLQAIYEVGIIGFIFFLLMIKRILRQAYQKISLPEQDQILLAFKQAFFIWFLCFVCLNQTSIWLHPTKVWAIIAMLIGITFKINLIGEIQAAEKSAPYPIPELSFS